MIITNHRTRLDWLIMLDMLYDYGRIPGLRFSLKSILGKVPFIGWFLQLNCHLFLHRKFEDDKKHIEGIFEFYKKSQEELTFVIYPEGEQNIIKY